jgi:hypothetical protein
MTVKLLANYGPYLPGDLFRGPANTEAGLVNLGMATADTTGGVVNVSVDKLPTSGGSLPWHAEIVGRAISAADDRQYVWAYNALAFTVPSGLTPRPTVCFLPPTSGQLSITGNINGSNQTIALGPVPATNETGWCLCANVASDGYTLLPNH